MVPPYGLWLRQAEVVEPEGAGAVVLQVDADANGAGRRNIGPGQRAPRAGAGEGQRGAAELHPVRVVARQRDVPRAGRGAGASLPAAIGVAQPWGNRDILSAPLPGQQRVQLEGIVARMRVGGIGIDAGRRVQLPVGAATFEAWIEDEVLGGAGLEEGIGAGGALAVAIDAGHLVAVPGARCQA